MVFNCSGSEFNSFREQEKSHILILDWAWLVVFLLIVLLSLVMLTEENSGKLYSKLTTSRY